MIKKIIKSIDAKTFLLFFCISVVWIVLSDHLVHKSIYKYFDAHFIQTAKGLFYITVLSLLLAYSHRREKNALLKRQEDFSRLFYDSPQAMMIFSVEDFRILDVNLSAEQLYGHSKEEFLTLNVLDIRPVGEREKFKLLNQKLLNQPTYYKGKWIHLKKNGESFPVEIHSRGIYFNGLASRLVNIKDISEMSAAEELSQIQSKMIILGEVSANIGHEIKNPLAIISLASQKLRSTLNQHVSTEHYEDDLDSIDNGVNRINDTINSLQRLSRNESSDQKELIYVSLLVKESVILMRRLFEHMSVRIEVGHLPEVKILCHQGEMTQVLLNLMKNGFDAMCAQKLDQKVILIDSAMLSDKIFIKVKNTGPKIDNSIVDQIFRPYFTTKNKTEGTGLGLAISKKIMKSMGGDLFLDTNDPLTTFVIELPLNQKSA